MTVRQNYLFACDCDSVHFHLTSHE